MRQTEIKKLVELTENARQTALRIFNPDAAEAVTTENDGFDVVSNPNGTVSGGQVPPPAPAPQTSQKPPQQDAQGAWGWQQQREWNKKIETEMKEGFANMATKKDIQELTALVQGQKPQAPQQNPPPQNPPVVR